MAKKTHGSGSGRSTQARAADDPTRTPDGRFRKDYCPNPKGRPPKPKPKPDETILAILEEEIALGDGSESKMPYFEFLVRSLRSHATKHPSIGLKLLELALQMKANAGPASQEASEDDAAAVLASFMAREARRRGGRSGAGDPEDEGGDDD